MAAEKQLTFTDFVDLVLSRLYEADKAGVTGLIDVNAVANSFKHPVNRRWPRDAGSALRLRGWADVIFTFGGCHARITAEGRLYVEQEINRKESVVADYFDHPAVFVQGDGNTIQVNTGDAATQTQSVTQERQPAFDLVEQMVATLKSDNKLAKEERNDFLADVEAIKLQLNKREPNRNILSATLDALSKVGSIRSLVVDLISLVNT